MSLLMKLDTGDVFYTDIPAKQATSYAYLHDLECRTEVVMVIEGHMTGSPTIRKITKVTKV